MNYTKGTKGDERLTDSKELEKVISASGFRRDHIASKCGLTRQSLKNKIDNKTKFNIDEVKALCDLLHIDTEQMLRLFFV